MKTNDFFKQKNLKIRTLTTTVTGSAGSATAKLYPNNTIVVEATTMNDDKTITLTTPIAFKVTGMRVIATTTQTGLSTVGLLNDTDAITDTVDMGIADTYFADAALINDAYDTFADGDDDLVVTFVADPASTPSTNTCRVIIYIQPN
jgi:hypothetical protein